MNRRDNFLKTIDWISISLYFLLVLFGWVNIYAAVYNEEHANIFDFSQKYGKQMWFIIFSFIIALVILFIEANFYTAFAYPIYVLGFVSLVAVLFFGKEVSGSHSWFRIGDLGIQPAEFVKFATCLALAKYLSSLNIRMNDLKTKIISAIIVLVPFGMIILENETGTALVYTAFVFVMYREGLSGNFLLIGFFMALLFILALLFNKMIIVGVIALVCFVIFILLRKTRRNIFIIIASFIISAGSVLAVDYAFSKLEPHQKTRINVFLGKEQSKESKKKAGYNVNQSKIAIGSGGVTGKGFLQGTQTKYDFVPEQSTDFIFCTVGEEWGFIGSAVVLFLFLALVLRIIFIAERQRSIFSRIYGYGVASILFFHITVNIGMTIGFAPVIGIPLPFFSYGGSSLWAFTILLFIFLKLDSNRLAILR